MGSTALCTAAAPVTPPSSPFRIARDAPPALQIRRAPPRPFPRISNGRVETKAGWAKQCLDV
eukprot:4800118-Pleurochrysis_carterae.AAC.1